MSKRKSKACRPRAVSTPAQTVVPAGVANTLSRDSLANTLSRASLELPDRRTSVRITWPAQFGGHAHELTVTFGIVPDGDGMLRVVEAFCSGGKEGSDFRAAVSDGCIALSRGVQRGDSFAQLARALGEDRSEGETRGPPASPLGAIARKAVEIETWVNSGAPA